jgi:lysozyme
VKKICPAGPTLSGVDVYHGNKVISFAGNSFVLLKASEGASYTDEKFANRWAWLKELGIPRGAYHFFRPSVNALDQAAHFAQVLGKLEDGDIQPLLDVEVLDGHSAQEARSAVLYCLDALQKKTGRHPMIYGSPYFLEALKLPVGIPSALMIAHYGVSCPLVPSAWSNWAIWQWSDSGIDKDKFNGDAQALKNFIAASKVA